MSKKTSWFGHGTPPYPGDTRVKVWFRSGTSHDWGTIGTWMWNRDDREDDIVAYEVIGDATHEFQRGTLEVVDKDEWDCVSERRGRTPLPVFNTALEAIAAQKLWTRRKGDLKISGTRMYTPVSEPSFTGVLPVDAAARKAIPVYSGFIAYFPDAICAVAELSRKGNDQHNPGKPLHWDRSKSGDELDAEMRHMIDGVKTKADTDGVWHKTKKAWRAMADLQKAIEEDRK